MCEFDPNDEKTWPILLTPSEVARILRYANTAVVYDLMKTSVEKGVLKPTLYGLGRKKPKRVHRNELLAFIARSSVNAAPSTVIAVPKRHLRTKARGSAGMTFAERYGRAS